MRAARCGKFRFSIDERSVVTLPSLGDFAVGGAVASDPNVYRSFTAPLAVGTLHHRGGLYATGLLRSLPDPGVSNFQHSTFDSELRWWEPPPGWGNRGRLARRPKCCIVFGSLVGLADEFGPLFDASLGASVLFAGRTQESFSSLVAGAFPTTGISEADGGDSGFFNRYEFLPPDLIAGGDLLVIDLSDTEYGYGGFTALGNGQAGGSGGEFSKLYSLGQTPEDFDGVTTFSAVYDDPLLPGESLQIRLHFRNELLDAARSHAAAVAERMDSFRHVVIQGDEEIYTGSAATTPLDGGAIFDHVSGGLPFFARRRFSAGSAAEAASLIADEIADFFA